MCTRSRILENLKCLAEQHYTGRCRVQQTLLSNSHTGSRWLFFSGKPTHDLTIVPPQARRRSVPPEGGQTAGRTAAIRSGAGEGRPPLQGPPPAIDADPCPRRSRLAPLLSGWRLLSATTGCPAAAGRTLLQPPPPALVGRHLFKFALNHPRTC